jgi:signal transduction histidine kinase/AmiR/NasT family two-component response regulator
MVINVDPFSDEFEQRRLCKSRSYAVVDNEVKEHCQNVARLCQQTFRMPISLVAFVEEDEVQFKGEAGISLPPMARYDTVCGRYTIFSEELVIIRDKRADELCIDLGPLGPEATNLPFYAGTRLVTDDGYPIGVLCVVDVVPRDFGEEDRNCLIQMGKFLMDEIELRKRNFELGEAKKQAESAHRLKSAFLANMSHEIRTPLTSLLGMIDMLAVDPDLNESQKSTVHLMQECGSTLHHILNDVLDFSKIEANQLRIEKVEFEPEEIVKSTVNLLAAKSKIHGVNVELSYSKSGRRSCNQQVLSDPTRLKQIIWNLVDNAIKFSPHSGGVVSVKVQEFHNAREVPESARIKMEEDKLCDIEDNEILLYSEVEDQGEGIPSDQLQRIFAPFEQVDSSTTRKHGGTGLGLSIVTNILKLMKGAIFAESQLGQGSKFWFALKMNLSVKNNSSASTSPVSPDGSNSSFTRSLSTSSDRSMEEKHSKRILVAEDNKMIRTMVGKRLTSLGHRPTLTCDGQEATDELKRALQSNEEFFDVFLCDMFMPIKDGAATMEEVRTSFPEPAQSIPIIAFTADVLEESVARYLKCGADALIGKPVDWKRLEEMLQSPPKNEWKSRKSCLEPPEPETQPQMKRIRILGSTN